MQIFCQYFYIFFIDFFMQKNSTILAIFHFVNKKAHFRLHLRLQNKPLFIKVLRGIFSFCKQKNDFFKTILVNNFKTSQNYCHVIMTSYYIFFII